MTETKQQSEADRTGKMEAVVEPPPASESSLELEADDILEVDGIPSHPPKVVVEADDAAEERSEAPADRTLPMKRSDVVAAAAKAADLQELDYELPQVTKIIPPTPAPPKTSPVLTTTKAMPGQNVVGGSHHPASVAPVAMDRTPTTALPLPPPPMKSPAVPIVVGGVLLAAILGIAGAAAGFALGSEPEKSTATAPSASVSATTTAEAPATVAAASPPPAPSPDPVTVPQTPAPKSGGFSEGTAAQPAPTLDNMPSSDVTSLPSAPSKSAPPPQHAFVAADPPPAPAPRPAAPPPPKPSAPPAKTVQAAPPPPAAPAAQSTTGVVRVPISDSIVTIQVDGHFRRVNSGAVIVSCGPHSVRVGSSMAKDVNVPCGGSVSVD